MKNVLVEGFIISMGVGEVKESNKLTCFSERRFEHFFSVRFPS